MLTMFETGLTKISRYISPVRCLFEVILSCTAVSLLPVCKVNKRRLTCAIKHGQQDGGDPGGVAVADLKLPDQLFEKHADRFGERIRETGDDEAPSQDRPAPAPIRSLHAARVHVHSNTSHYAASLRLNFNNLKENKQQGWMFSSGTKDKTFPALF